METTSENKTSVASPWSFRDGKEYIVSVSVHDRPRSMGILISDKITAEEWSCHYDLKYIEDLTQRTGNYKPFDTFVTMIKCAILKNSDAVALDLMTYDDLKFIKSKRHRDGIVITNEFHPNMLPGEVGNRDQTSDSALSKRKYLIVTYVAEFDNVHYPIPLHYSGPPDPHIMQNNIKKLQAEVNLLKSTNSDLRGRLSVRNFEGQTKADSSGQIFVRANRKRSDKIAPQSRSDSPDAPIRESQNKANANSGQGKPDSRYQLSQFSSMEIEQMQKLLASIHRLEQKIVTERAEHLDQMEKLQSENSYLREKINELQISEQALNLQITRLEAMFKLQIDAGSTLGRKSSMVKPGRNRNPSVPKQKSQPQPNTVRTKTLYTRPKSPYYPPRVTSEGRPPKSAPVPHKFFKSPGYRPSSTDSNRRRRPSNYSTGFQLESSQSRSRTVSPVPRFDPTYYVEKQKMRQAERNKLRLENIRANFSKPERVPIPLTNFSSTSRDRGRSTSAGKSSRGNRSGFYTPNGSNVPSRKSSVTRNSQDFTRRSASRSPPRNVEIRLAQRKTKLQQKHGLISKAHGPLYSRGRSIERRTSSRTIHSVGDTRAGKSNRVRTVHNNTSAETMAFELFSSTSGGVHSAQASKSSSVAWMSSEDQKKLFQFSRPQPDPNSTYILKDLEGSLDSLQAFVNTTNQALGYVGHSN